MRIHCGYKCHHSRLWVAQEHTEEASKPILKGQWRFWGQKRRFQKERRKEGWKGGKEKGRNPQYRTECIQYLCFFPKFPFHFTLCHWPFQGCSLLEYISIIYLSNTDSWGASSLFSWRSHHLLGAKDIWRQTLLLRKISSWVKYLKSSMYEKSNNTA